MFNVHCPIVQQRVTELLNSAEEGARRRRRKRGLKHPHSQTPQYQVQSCALSVVLLQGLGCYCTVPQLDAGGNGKMGQKPSALVRDLACEYRHEPLLPGKAVHYRAAKEQPCSFLQLWAALTASRRGEGAAMPSAVTSTFSEGIWAIAHKPPQWELWFPPSAITPKLLFCHPAVRKEREECGSEQGTAF